MNIQEKRTDLSKEFKDEIDSKLSAKKRLEDFFQNSTEFGHYGDQILACLKFTENSYQLLAEELPLDKLNRTKSLVGRHLFISNQYPHPVTSVPGDSEESANEIEKKSKLENKLFPVLQLDMSWVSSVTGKDFEPCLLQFWLEAPIFVSGVVRKIPLTDVKEDELLPIELDPEVYKEGCFQFGFESPEERLSFNEINWVEVPEAAKQASFQILECHSIGVTSPYLDDYILEELSEEEYSEFIPQSIWDDIRIITSPVNPQIKTNLRSVLQIFGSFFISSNDSVTDFAGDGCLFSFDRGSRQSSVVTYWEKDANTGESKFSYN